MPRDRFLIGIVVGISVVMIAALVFFFARQGQVQYLDDSQPAGALHNYILAIQQRDYRRAYDALSPGSSRPSFEQFQAFFEDTNADPVGRVTVEIDPNQPLEPGDSVEVQVHILETSSNPFDEVRRSVREATLVRLHGTWKILRAPYPFWGYNW